MRHAHTVEQVRTAEHALMARLPEGTLMQRAATGLAGAVLDLLDHGYGARVLLLVGSGDNGGDALYAGVLLARRGVAVYALLLNPDRAHGAGLAAFRAAGGRTVPDVAAAGDVDVAVDAIVGIGGRPGLRPDAAAVVEALAEVPILAVDVPSGVDVDTGRLAGPHVRADVTVTFGTHKIAHLVDPAAAACGAVHLVDLGLDLPDPPVSALQAVDVARMLPVPDPGGHKYTRGVVGVRAGSDEYAGAGVLCVGGAACGLAGMVRYDPVTAADDAEGSGAGHAVDLVRAAHPEVVLGAGRVQAWVVGSGGGAGAGRALKASMEDGVPVVVDADALTHCAHLDSSAVAGGSPAERPQTIHRSRLLLTPHAGELARMLEVAREDVEADQLGSAQTAAERFGCVVLLKGRHTLVVAPDGRTRVNTTGTPWLATAGAGDVLAGLCGALLAAGLDPFDAGAVGAWLH
ncbi:MAG: NAD(P)H-hydrate epimerase, partial [Nocardioidaceae bacterium]